MRPLNPGRCCTARHPVTGERCTRRWMHWGEHRARSEAEGLIRRWFGSAAA